MTPHERPPRTLDRPDGGTPAVRALPDWLALRRDIDTEARDAGAGRLLGHLVDHLRACGARAVRVVDVGAGTGANHAYLAPRLPLPQSWVVVDHDPDLLADTAHGGAVRVRAGVRDLVPVVDELVADGDGPPLLVTCAALLDVLDTAELDRLAEAVRRAGGVALLSLSVTGAVTWAPQDEGDAAVGALFDAHQRRGGRPGPDAADVLAVQLRAGGLTVLPVSTPWRLDSRRDALLGRWLDERAAAAAEQAGPGRAAEALEGWHARRREQLGSDRLGAHVDHVDLLVLPDRAQPAAG